jgi:hypothetical protein
MADWNWIWTRLLGEVSVVVDAPLLFLLCVITLATLASFVVYRASVVRSRRLLEKKEDEIELLKSKILMLKVRLASRSGP